MRVVHPVTAAVLVASAMATGCLGGTPHADVATVPTTGVIVTVGGPAPGAPAPSPGVELRLVGAGGSVNVRADRRGRFTAYLAPGTYRVTITGHGHHGRWGTDAAHAGRDRRPTRGRPSGATGRLDQVAVVT